MNNLAKKALYKLRLIARICDLAGISLLALVTICFYVYKVELEQIASFLSLIVLSEIALGMIVAWIKELAGATMILSGWLLFYFANGWILRPEWPIYWVYLFLVLPGSFFLLCGVLNFRQEVPNEYAGKSITKAIKIWAGIVLLIHPCLFVACVSYGGITTVFLSPFLDAFTKSFPICLPDLSLAQSGTIVTDQQDIPMALIPAGSFWMGHDVDDMIQECALGFANDGKMFCTYDVIQDTFERYAPAHEVELEAFYMDVYEVTNGRYQECVQAGVCQPPSEFACELCPKDDNWPIFDYYDNLKYTNYPVEWMPWLYAKAYCEWRGARLPTEAEWEKAARGGLVGKEFPWGNWAPINMKNCKNGVNKEYQVVPVGSYSPNGYGLYDIVGNVGEWVSSKPMPYPYSFDDGRESLEIGIYPENARSFRGLEQHRWTNVFYRGTGSENSGMSDVGFRCAVSVNDINLNYPTVAP